MSNQILNNNNLKEPKNFVYWILDEPFKPLYLKKPKNFAYWILEVPLIAYRVVSL